MERLLLPREWGRQALAQLCFTLVVVASFLMLEVATFFVTALLGEHGLRSMSYPGVYGYLALPILAGAFTLPLFLRLTRPALRIDEAGISKVRRGRVETAPWDSVDAVHFSRNRVVLVLRLRAGATLPGKSRVLERPAPLAFYDQGYPLFRGRRRKRCEMIAAAVERFAPGTFNGQPYRFRQVKR